MPRPGLNISFRKDGRYEGRTIKGRRANGKPLFASVYGNSYEETLEKLARLKASLRKQESDEAQRDLSYQDFLLDWLSAAKKILKPSTYGRYHDRIHRHILPLMGALRLQAITPKHIDKLISRLAKQGLSTSAVSSVLSVVRTSLSRAKEQGLIQENPFDSFHCSDCKPKELSSLTRFDL